MTDPLEVPSHRKQVVFHQMLVAARKSWLVDALREAVTELDPRALKHELGQYVPAKAAKTLGAAGIRDEEVFPTPLLIEAAPTLVGYYRLLLGISQKQFYRGSTGLGPFFKAEVAGVLTDRARELLPEFCKTMCEALSNLVAEVSPTVTPRDVAELPLLTLGAAFYGSNNNTIGAKAAQDVLLAIAEVVQDHLVERKDTRLVVKNSAGRRVTITLASDPDVRVEEEFPNELRRKVALEVKGGTDASNAHNRAGEAEKSHIKAKSQGFVEFWTVIATKAVDERRLKSGSPTTTFWFNVAEVLGRQGPAWEEFRSRIADVVGIPEPT